MVNIRHSTDYKTQCNLSKKQHGYFGATTGIVILRTLGVTVAEFANNFQPDLIGYTPYRSKGRFHTLHVKQVESDDLPRRSDVVICHFTDMLSTKEDVSLRNLRFRT